MPVDLLPFDLAGTWALEVIVTSSSRAPIIGEVRSASRSRMLVKVTEQGGAWNQHQEVCTSSLEGGSKLAKTVIPPAWVKAMRPQAYTVTLVATEEGWAYVADTGVQTIGYDAALGPLPARGADAQVVDADEDGHPGATVFIEVPGFGRGEIYIAHRGHSRLEGRVVSPERIEGQVVMLESAQATIGASHKVFDFSPVTHPDPLRSTFAMWRVAAGTECDRI